VKITTKSKKLSEKISKHFENQRNITIDIPISLLKSIYMTSLYIRCQIWYCLDAYLHPHYAWNNIIELNSTHADVNKLYVKAIHFILYLFLSMSFFMTISCFLLLFSPSWTYSVCLLLHKLTHFTILSSSIWLTVTVRGVLSFYTQWCPLVF
jgi:hypothetical protein